MRTRTNLLAGGVAAALIAGASGVALAASPSAPPQPSKAAVSGPAVPKSSEDGKVGKSVKGDKAGKGGVAPAPRSFFDDRSIALLAAQLGVTDDKARQIADKIKTLADKGSIEPADPAFVAIASFAGTTPQQLAAALDAVKKAS